MEELIEENINDREDTSNEPLIGQISLDDLLAEIRC